VSDEKHTWLAWDDIDDKILTENWIKGMPSRQISLLLRGNRSKNSVIGRAHRLGLSNQGHHTVTRKLASKARAAAKPKREPKPMPVKPHVVPRHVEPPSLDERAFARPWEAREAHQCAWPLDGEGGIWSCCAPTASTYCKRHTKKMFEPRRPAPLNNLAAYIARRA